MKVSSYLGLSGLLSLMAVTIPAHAFDRNISGVWDDPNGKTWGIAQYNNDMTFSRTINGDATGRVTLTFSNTIVSGGKDKFSFSASGNSFTAVLKGKSCRFTTEFLTNGIVVGQAPGRRIHMSNCNMIMESSKCDEYRIYNCDGVWK